MALVQRIIIFNLLVLNPMDSEAVAADCRDNFWCKEGMAKIRMVDTVDTGIMSILVDQPLGGLVELELAELVLVELVSAEWELVELELVELELVLLGFLHRS